MPTVQDIRAGNVDGPITMLTAYDAVTASVVDDAGVHMILVGDSMGNTVLGYDSTLPVTVDEIASRTGAVTRATTNALVVADLPFLSFGTTFETTVSHAGRMLKEENADAVKLESGPHTTDLTEQLVQLGIPVMAHLGLTPQRVKQYGGYPRQGTTQDTADNIRLLAHEHEQAGAFSLVLEHIPANVAQRITEELTIPTIGIGAGPHTTGQVLVITDVLGLTDHTPPFAQAFGDLRAEMHAAVTAYQEAVAAGEFPGDEHSYTADDLGKPY